MILEIYLAFGNQINENLTKNMYIIMNISHISSRVVQNGRLTNSNHRSYKIEFDATDTIQKSVGPRFAVLSRIFAKFETSTKQV